MLRRVRITGYRALKDVTIEVTPGVPAVLIGENASGKTTLLDALALLRSVAQGRGGAAISSRGGWDAVRWRGSADHVELTATFSEDSFPEERGPVEYFVRLGAERRVPTVLDEEVRVYERAPGEPPFVVLKGGVRAWAHNRKTREADEVQPPSEDSSILRNAALAGVVDASRYPTCVRLRKVLQRIAFYPSFGGFTRSHEGELGREASAREVIGARPVERVERISSDGRDLLSALHTLSTEHPRAWTALQSDLGAVFPWCQALRFPPGPGRGLLTLTWEDRRSGATLYLDDMSEGMLVYLALLAALHAQDAPALLAFDEPERSLHPHALRRLVKVIESRAESTPILVATHADRLLDFLEDPAGALRITRFSGDAGVIVESLDPELLRAWLAEYTLSELRARDMLERADEEDDA